MTSIEHEKLPVLIKVRGEQYFDNIDPDATELTTEGTMEFRDGGWDICYEESALTGLEGVTTTFRVEPGRVILDRTGKLNSRMVFQEGVSHESLYQMEFGALMLSVKAEQVFFDIMPDGGVIDLVYSIVIENTEAGVIDYHLDFFAKE